MPGRKHKKYKKPRKIYDAALIKEENDLIKKYGLKSRREIWKADFAIGKIRNLAKKLIAASEEEKNKFLEKQMRKGFLAASIADILGLNKEDWLKRRLQSVIVKKGLARTHMQARQFITHKHITINGKIIDAPSHMTSLEEEQNVAINLSVPEQKIISDEEKEILQKMKISGNKEESAEDGGKK